MCCLTFMKIPSQKKKKKKGKQKNQNHRSPNQNTTTKTHHHQTETQHSKPKSSEKCHASHMKLRRSIIAYSLFEFSYLNPSKILRFCSSRAQSSVPGQVSHIHQSCLLSRLQPTQWFFFFPYFSKYPEAKHSKVLLNSDTLSRSSQKSPIILVFTSGKQTWTYTVPALNSPHSMKYPT